MAQELIRKYSCKQDNCPVKSNGLCLEGLKVDECSYALLLPEEYVEKEDGISTPILEKEDFFPLYSGEELSEDEIHRVSYEKRPTLILIMGEPNSGKTTMLASTFDLFQKGKFGGFSFSGTKTPIGFEKRCHLARVTSGLTTPDTERTRSTDFHFLHLALKRLDLRRQFFNLLFADISGEQFKLARDQDQEMKRLKIMLRADKIFFTVDGELLTDKSKRQSVKQDIVKLIGRAEQNDMVDNSKGIIIVITKWDKVLEYDSKDSINSFFIHPLIKRFPQIIKNLITVSARPKTPIVQVGTGLDQFLQLCTEQNLKHTNSFTELGSDIREFQKFKFRS